MGEGRYKLSVLNDKGRGGTDVFVTAHAANQTYLAFQFRK